MKKPMPKQQMRTQAFRKEYGQPFKTKTPFGHSQNTMNDPIELAISVVEEPFSVEDIARLVDDPLIIVERVKEHIRWLAGQKDGSSRNHTIAESQPYIVMVLAGGGEQPKETEWRRFRHTGPSMLREVVQDYSEFESAQSLASSYDVNHQV